MNRHIIIPLLFIAGFFSTAVAAASGREPAVTADSTQAKGRVTPGLLFETSQLRSTSAVSTADGPALAKNRQTNLTNSFAGQFTGLTLFQGSGEPGNDMASWLVRGIGSYGKPGYNTAKIFVDGFEVNADYIAYLSPAEIDKVSVLKDGAALSIFGDRGANGVIWIETKRGEIGPASVSASVHYGIQQATTYAKPLDSYGYATLYNQAVSNDNGSWSPAYDAAALEAYRNGSATNVDWYDEVLRDSGYVIDGDVTFRGGTQTARYNVVLNYLNQQGLFDVSNSDSRSNRTYERYGLRANLDFTMFKFIEARVDLGGRIERGKRPNITIDDLFYNMARYPSNIYEIWDDEAHTHYSGTSTYNSNPVASINALGWRQAQSRVLQGNFQLVERLDFITEGLYLREAFSFNTYTTSGYSKTRNYARYHNGVRTTTDEDTSLQASGYGSDGMEDWKQGHISLGYDRQFGRHAVDAAVNLHISAYNGDGIFSYQYHYLNYNGRVNYSYDDRYVAEFGFSYFGNDAFAPGNRWSFYPSISAAWVLSNESFLRDSKVIDLLKLRLSYGRSGFADSDATSVLVERTLPLQGLLYQLLHRVLLHGGYRGGMAEFAGQYVRAQQRHPLRAQQQIQYRCRCFALGQALCDGRRFSGQADRHPDARQFDHGLLRQEQLFQQHRQNDQPRFRDFGPMVRPAQGLGLFDQCRSLVQPQYDRLHGRGGSCLRLQRRNRSSLRHADRSGG